jgi:hypothetical protein
MDKQEFIRRWGEMSFKELGEYIDRLELGLHQIAGHGNITGDRARQVACETLGLRKVD